LPALAKILIIAGLLLVAMGLVVWLAQGHLSWLGRLPGDIRMERPGMKFYFPITTMILASVLLTVLLWIIRRFF
jgi:H+/Cl- antiporter ClcA